MLLDVESIFFWNRQREPTLAYIHCIEYDYKTDEGKVDGESDFKDMVATRFNEIMKAIKEIKDEKEEHMTKGDMEKIKEEIMTEIKGLSNTSLNK